ncbi:MAG: hypothetical protein ACTSWM_00115 [Alphaproteobacteria bacterium]
MIDFRVEFRVGALAALTALAGVVLLGPAWAQEPGALDESLAPPPMLDQPVPAQPAFEQPAFEQPEFQQRAFDPPGTREVLPGTDFGTSDRPFEPSTAPSGVSTDVSVGTLETFDAESFGTLTVDRGGLDTDLWRGSQRTRIDRLFAMLPLGAPSPAMHNLIRRMMLSQAGRPQGDSEGFLGARLGILARAGAFDGFNTLLASAPQSAISDHARRHQSNVLLLSVREQEACALIREQVRNSDAPYWQKGLMVCQIFEGGDIAARLGLDLLREQGWRDSTGFGSLLSVRIGDISEVDPALVPDALNFALLRESGLKIPQSFIDNAGPAVLMGLARADALPLDVRLVAAERAAASGALSPERLAEMYFQVDVAPSELANPIDAARQSSGPWSRAVLFQASRQEPSPTVRAMVLGEAWRSAQAATGLGPAARASGLALSTFSPGPAMLEFAPFAARAELISGHVDAARAWIDELARSEAFDPSAALALAQLRPVLAVADPEAARSAWQPAWLVDWWQSAAPPETRLERASRLFIALDAFGVEVGATGWDLMLDGPIDLETRVPVVGLRYALRDAVRAGALGESLLLTLIVIGEQGPAGAAPIALGNAIRTLRRLGLDDEARAFAVEALIDGDS